MSFVASYGQLGSQGMLVARSWDLGALEQRYEDFIDEFTGLDPETGEAALRAQTRLVHEWRRFPSRLRITHARPGILEACRVCLRPRAAVTACSVWPGPGTPG